ncbi:hypothetical protein FRB91_003054 [Serendipita sp. 411]|nr:hypothetical protein FRB91_003054 [Serendipita sp. 411]
MQGSSSPMDNSTSIHQYCKRCSTCHSTCGGTPNRIGLFIETHLDETVDPTQGTYMSAPILRDPCLASGSPVSPGMRFATLMGRSQDLSPSTSAHGDWNFTPPSTGDTTTTITDLASLPASLSGVLETGLPILTPYSTIQIPSIPDGLSCNIFADRFCHLNPTLGLILDRIVSSPFFLQHTKEPRIESPEGQYLCATNALGLCFPESDEGRTRRGRSIYLVFVDMENRRCLICEKTGRSRSYLLECVRRDLGHRPYWCGGFLVGCRVCRQTRAHFFSRRLLDNHLYQQVSRRGDARTHRLDHTS